MHAVDVRGEACMRRSVWVLLLMLPYASAVAFSPTSAYEEREVRGWKILVHQDLLTSHSALADEVFDLLDSQLHQIVRVVPAGALEKLRTVPIWVEVRDKNYPCMCYHPSAEWLGANGYNPEKAGSVEIANAGNFLAWTKDQPWMVLHELAHAYHHQVLGHGNAKVKEAYHRAVKERRYETVVNISGRVQRHYALNNDQEYFAEATEAYFGTNDFFPFVRAELRGHDPHFFELLGELWGVP